jgi:hypothetical protein
VADASGVPVSALRSDVLSLSQPAEAGWHFYADDRNPEQAEALAATWAKTFTDQAQSDMAAQVGLNSFVRVDATQVEDLPVYRRVSRGAYLLAGSVGFFVLIAFLALFVKPRTA